MLLPARTAVLNYLYSVEKSDITQIMEALKPIYGEERPFKRSAYLDHVMSLEANGLVTLCDYDLDQKGELRMYFAINEDGKSAVEKYIDKKYRI